MSKLLIRADAGIEMGTGHVMRCLAIAQDWQMKGGQALFVMARSTSNIDARLTTESIPVIHLKNVSPGSLEDAQETAVMAENVGARWIVIDGYHFDANYQKYLKDAGYNLLVWDYDGRASHYYADFVLNQNIQAEPGLYESREPYTQLLLGTSYAVLRQEFWSWRDWEREIPEKAKNVLVTMGGSDPDNVTLRVIQALQQIEDNDLQVIVVVGGSNPHHASLKAEASGSEQWLHLRSNVTDMPALMAWADTAISAAGSTSWELLFMGLPALLLVLADNQETGASYLHNENAAVNLGSGKELDASTLTSNLKSLTGSRRLRQALSSRGAQLVDGYGVQRVTKALSASSIVEGT